jgi:hypothetical protein
VRRRTIRGGSIQYIQQCLDCGQSVGNPRKHSAELLSAPIFDEELESKVGRARNVAYQELIQKHIRIQRDRTVGFWEKYNKYLLSQEWGIKRSKVLARAQANCEGCGMRPPTQVHHLTYRHIFEEFLFELVAVCDHYHKRLHIEATAQDAKDSRVFKTAAEVAAEFLKKQRGG